MYSPQGTQVGLGFAIFVAFLISIPGYVLALYQYNSAQSEEMQRITAEYQRKQEQTARVAAEAKAREAEVKAADAEVRLRLAQVRSDTIQSRSAANSVQAQHVARPSPAPSAPTVNEAQARRDATELARIDTLRLQCEKAVGSRVTRGELNDRIASSTANASCTQYYQAVRQRELVEATRAGRQVSVQVGCNPRVQRC